MTFYYENLLENKNYTAKPNVAQTTDIISFESTYSEAFSHHYGHDSRRDYIDQFKL